MYLRLAKYSNATPDKWKCVKVRAKPYWVEDAKSAGLMGHVILHIQKDFKPESLDTCKPLIKDLKEIDKLKRLIQKRDSELFKY